MATGTFPTTLNAAQLQRVAKMMHTYGLLPKPFNVAPLLVTG